MQGAGNAAPAESAAVVPLVEAADVNTFTLPCPCCGTAVPVSREAAQAALNATRAEAIAARVEILRHLCADRGWRIVAGDLVSEAVAADMLGKSKGHLRNLRLGTRPIPCRLVLGTWMYALDNLAAVLENRDDE